MARPELPPHLRLPFVAALAILALAKLGTAVMQLSTPHALTPWEPAVAMEAVRLNAGLPVYETVHATHLYGPLLTVTFAAVLQIFNLNLLAVRIFMSICAITFVIFLSAIVCPTKSSAGWATAILLFLGINFRTNLILFSTQPDYAAAFLATVALYLWITGNNSPPRVGVSLALFICATLFKQTAAAFAFIPVAYVLLWKRPLRLSVLALSFLPTISILLVLTAIWWGWPQMFTAIVTIPAAIKVYPGRAWKIALYLFLTFPIFLIALWSIWRSRRLVTDRERWILSALIVLVPVSIWMTCKSGSGYNSLLFAYLAMTALFILRLDVIFDWLRSLSVPRGFVAAVAIALAILTSFFLQFERMVTLLSLRHGDDKYDAVVSIVRGLNGIVVAPQDPTIPYRAKGFFGRSLFFELDTHAVNGNWPEKLPASIRQELEKADYVVSVRSYVPTTPFERSLPQIGFHQVSFPELQDSAYTIWSKTSD